MRYLSSRKISLFAITACLFVACGESDIEPGVEDPVVDDPDEPTLISEEYYTGGELGTTFTATTFCFEQSTPAVDNGGMGSDFLRGEAFFEDYFTSEKNEGIPMMGRGPLSIRHACIDCHPGYGHSKRIGSVGGVTKFDTSDNGNGYLLVVYGSGADGVFGDDEPILSGITGPTWIDNATDDAYVDEVTGMPQTQSISPFPAPLDESKITIEWKVFTDEHNNTYADGTTYELIYPEVSIPSEAIKYVDDPLFSDISDPSKYRVKVEATIGIYGTGLIDAITESDIDAEAALQAGESWGGRRGAEIPQLDGSVRKGRYTYALSRGTLQHGPGSNALWNITNVTRGTSNQLYRSNYCTVAYASAASKDAEVLEALKNDSYYNFLIVDGDITSEATENSVYNYLMWNNSYSGEKLTSANYTEYIDTDTQRDAELSLEEYTQFMVWHRGLAVPAARDLEDETIQRGKELFYSDELSCTACHRPSWTTGDDEYVGDADMKGKLPQYPYQKIWPYSDFLQHNLGMKNNIRTSWCRTTPLWGRYLNLIANGESSHLHDMRARNYYEAIMWHKGQGKYSSDAFRELSESDRDAVVEFLKSI